MTNVLCITGMHRSGTSLTTSWLQNCGLIIDNGLVYGVAQGNIKGHFEDKEFVDFHSKILKAENENSYGWKVYTQDYMYFSTLQREEAKQLVKKRNNLYNTWAWKDPRTTLFLQQWKIIIPELKVLLLWRPISEVVQSLLIRSKKSDFLHIKINFLEAIKLWYSYNKIVCKFKKEFNHDTLLIPLNYVINYDQKLVNLLNSKFALNLHYIPLNEIYESQLMKKSSQMIINKFSLLDSLPSISDLEKKLYQLSDFK